MIDLHRDVLRTHPVFDGHNDLAWELREQFGSDPAAAGLLDQPALHTDVPRLRAGGVGAQFWSVYVPSDGDPAAAVVATFEQVDLVRRLVLTHPDVFAWTPTASAVRDTIAAGRIASLPGAEGGHSIGGSLGVLRELRRAGLAYLTLTHNDNTPWAASATGEPVGHGLTAFGHDVVREMNRIGVLVDLSHVHERTMHDALDTTTRPVLFSHSSCRAVTDHPRNVPDTVLERLPRNGGVLMVTFVPAFVNQACADHRRDGTGPAPRAALPDVVAHLEHARDVVGIDHVGLGGDYDGVDRLPDGLEDVSTYPALLTALADRGWSAADLRALTCGNVLRVLEDAQDGTSVD
ncbi:dipeptidase [Kineococcus rhizosphaerae]|uniref:Membrane dipeptidase n=1 Tax=Kineococcus rhizosphaerae TaxID=559628 RepID=A0A2T0RA86_9ACTN|nr:dipeptidase [Kineococcus rhizosphaerae]PRY18077.1 membrane dipeptidase [Kineococcus rhizosphaerae]